MEQSRTKIISIKKKPFFILLFIIVVLSAVLRLSSLSEVPAWYTDEGFYARVGWDMIHGHLETFGIAQWSFVSPHFTSPPLYLLISGLGMVVFGKTILVLRALSVLAGIATVYSLWHIGSRLFSRRAGLFLAALYAVLPVIVVNNRWGFPQTALGLAVLWSLYACIQYAKSGQKVYLYWGLGVFAAACAASYWVWPLAVVWLIFLWKHLRRKAIGVVALAFLPIVLVLLIRFLTIPSIFLSDIAALFSGGGFFAVSSLQENSSWIEQLSRAIYGLGGQNILFIVGIAGLMTAKQKTLRLSFIVLVVVFILPLLILRSNYEFIFYPALLFLPISFIGLGFLIQRIESRNVQYLTKTVYGVAAVYCVFLSLVSIVGIYQKTLAQSSSELLFISEPHVGAMTDVVTYINERTTDEDFVIAPNNINWGLRAFSVEPVWVACYMYADEFTHLDKSRFSRPLDIASASYAVIDKLFGGDASVCYSYREKAVERITRYWNLVYENDRFRVYAPHIAQ